jgi:hypothetical protein
MTHAKSHGAVVGRVANRTAGAAFELDGGPTARRERGAAITCMAARAGSGGRSGRWRATRPPTRSRLALREPGRRDGVSRRGGFAVTYRLEGPRLVVEMEGRPDRPTPINLAQHNYYNLAGGADVRDHVVRIAAELHAGRRGRHPDGRDQGGRRHPLRLPGAGELRGIGPGAEGRRRQPGARRRARPGEAGGGGAVGLDQPGAAALDRRAGAAGLQRAAAGDRRAGARRAALRAVLGPLPRGAALPRQPAPTGLAEHHPEPEAPYRQRLVVEIARS